MRKTLFLMLMILDYSLIGSHNQLHAQFVTVQNGKFMLNGQSLYFGGSNEYDLPAQETYASSEVDARLNAFATCGGTVMRVFFFYDGGSRCDEPNSDQTIQTSLGVYSEAALQAMDRVVKKAKDRGMKIIATLTNFQDANGGLGRYMYWTGHVSSSCGFDMYNSSQMNTALTATDMKNAIKGYFSMVLNRVNTVTGVAYKNEPTIMAWEIANEPRASGLSPSVLTNWLNEMALYIKSIDSNHLVCTGEEGHDDRLTGHSSFFNGYYGFYGEEGLSFTANTQLASIDFASIHCYPYLWGWANPITAGHYFISDAHSIAQAAGKPLILGEYGHASSPWYYPGPNDADKITAYNDWWPLIESLPVGGDLLWQFLEDGAPWWHNYSSANIYYTADNQIWPLFKQHALNMTAKSSPGTAPSTPTLASPANGATGVLTSPILSWNVAGGAASYGLQVSTASNFSTTVVNQSGISATSYTVTGLTTNTLYYWRVNATNPIGTSGWSSSRSFTTTSIVPPSAPVLASPTNGATGVSINPTLSWNASSGATSYQLQLSRSSNFSTTVIDQSGITTTSYAAIGLASNTVYYWRVNASNSGGAGSYSSARSFTTELIAMPYVAAYAFDEGSGTSAFDVSGNANTGTVSDTLWSTSGRYGNALSFNGSSSIVRVNNSSSLNLTTGMTVEAWVQPTTPAPDVQVMIFKEGTSNNQSYALGLDKNGSGNLRAGIYIMIGANEYGVNSSSTLSLNTWSHVAGTFDGASLRLYVNGSLEGSTSVSGSINQTDSYLTIGGNDLEPEWFAGLIDEVRIYNRALSQGEIQADMNSPIGATSSLPSVPIPSSPANGATGVATNPTLSWNASTGATSYGVQVSTNSSFSSTIVNQNGITTTSYAVSGLTNNTTYYWRVNATNAEGTSAWSSSRSFTTIVTTPSAPTLSSPANGATGVAVNPTLSWNTATGATSYGLQVSTSSSFFTTVVNQTAISTTSYAVSGLTGNTTYYWRVNATNAGGTSAWSSSRSFTTITGGTNHNIVLPEGWSMISSFVQPSNAALDPLLADIQPRLEIMKNGAGQVYWPTYAVNTIGNWDIRHGYQIYMEAADTLTITGNAVAAESTPISLIDGVNIVAYLRYTPMRADSAFTSIASSLTIVKNNTGEVYWPSYGINSIGSLRPGQGYQVQVTGASTLTYPASSGPAPPSIFTKQMTFGSGSVDISSTTLQVDGLAEDPPLPMHHVRSISNTGANAILLLHSADLSSGDEIAVWTPHRLLVGSGVMNQGRALITIWGDNSATENLTDGAVEGEALSLTVWSDARQRDDPLTLTSITDGLTGTSVGTTLRYETDAVWVADVRRAEQIPTAFTLFQNYPNPFNPSSVIKYGLPFTARVSLEVYNILGQRVVTLVNGERQAGYHEVVFENSTLGSGIYFYRLSANEFTQTKKMIIVR
jgi:hypothetical protein